MSKSILALSTFACITSGALGGSTAHAQEDISGSWQLASSSAEEAQRGAAIEASTRDLGALYRSRARARLTERTTPAPRIQISATGDRLEIDHRIRFRVSYQRR